MICNKSVLLLPFHSVWNLFLVKDKKSKHIHVYLHVHTFPFLEWKVFELDKLQFQIFSARVEFPCRCEEKRHRTLRECYRRYTLTGSGVSCCRGTLLGRSMHPFSVPLLSLFGLGHLTWLPERVTEGGRFALWRAGHSASLMQRTYIVVKLKWDGTDCAWQYLEACVSGQIRTSKNLILLFDLFFQISETYFIKTIKGVKKKKKKTQTGFCLRMERKATVAFTLSLSPSISFLQTGSYNTL